MRFSVVIPTYNRAERLSNAIESVINQIYSDWELIIVDDGSLDHTKKVVAQYLEEDKRIKYFYQENQERSIARNNGITLSKGNYICFLDSDDLYHETHLLKMNDLIEFSAVDEGLFISGISINKFDESEEVYRSSSKGIDFVFLNIIATSRACVSRAILEEFRFDPAIRIGEDTELWNRIASKYPVVCHSAKTYIQIEHKDRSVNQESNKEHYRTMCLIAKQSPELSSNVVKFVLSNGLFNISRSYLLKGNRVLGLLLLLRCLLKDFRHEQFRYRLNVMLRLLIVDNTKLKQLIRI